MSGVPADRRRGSEREPAASRGTPSVAAEEEPDRVPLPPGTPNALRFTLPVPSALAAAAAAAVLAPTGPMRICAGAGALSKLPILDRDDDTVAAMLVYAVDPPLERGEAIGVTLRECMGVGCSDWLGELFGVVFGVVFGEDFAILPPPPPVRVPAPSVAVETPLPAADFSAASARPLRPWLAPVGRGDEGATGVKPAPPPLLDTGAEEDNVDDDGAGAAAEEEEEAEEDKAVLASSEEALSSDRSDRVR